MPHAVARDDTELTAKARRHRREHGAERSSHGSGGTSLHDLWEKKMCERVTMINLVSCARYGGY
jgi:hypothetical protein